MAPLHNSCFICGKFFSKIDNFEDIDMNSLPESSDDGNIIKGETAKKCILQISRYLQIPKTKNKNEANYETSRISICPSCWNISRKLSKLCEEFEVTQMKITYYLNLLSDQIFSENDNSSTRTYHTKFHKRFHKKCALKLATTKVNPALRITKCKLSSQQAIIPEKLMEPLKLPNPSYKFPCKECPMVLLTASILERHVETSHRKTKTRQGHKIKSCELCGVRMSTANLNRHNKRVHGIFGKPKTKNLEVGKITVATNLEGRRMKRCKLCRKLISMTNLSFHERQCGNSDEVKVEQGEEQISKKLLVPKELNEPLKHASATYKFRCKECPMVLLTASILQRHVETSHRKTKTRQGHKIKSCELCGVRMSTANLNRHNKMVHGIFGKPKTNNLEVGKNTITTKFQGRKIELVSCKFCRKLVSEKISSFHETQCGMSNQVEIEQVEQNNSKKLGVPNTLNSTQTKCKTCGKRFVSKSTLMRHLRQSESCGKPEFKNRFECSNCNRRFSQMSYLSKHLKRVCKTGRVIDNGELVLEQEIKIETDQGEPITDFFPDQNSPISEMADDSANEPIDIDVKLETSSMVNACPFCEFSANGPYEIINGHIEANHPEKVQTEESEDKKLPCGYCGQLFPSKGLKLHRRICRKEKGMNILRKIKCVRCGKDFANSSSLTRHLRINANCGFDVDRKNAEFVDRFECSICHLRFSRRSNINSHLEQRYCKDGKIIDHGMIEDKQTDKDQNDGNISLPCEDPNGNPKLANEGEIILQNNDDIFITGDVPLQI